MKNKMFFIYTFLALVLPNTFCFAQTINGYVAEAGSGEALIGVSVVDTLTHRGTVTNEYGFFSLHTYQKRICLRVSYVGHEPQTLCLNTARDTSLTIALQGMTFKAVTIKASEAPNSRQQNLTTVVQIPVSQLAQVPTLGGENDVLKVLATTPGVTTGVEGTSALLVRGGSADQTMVLLDEAVVYNISHVHGFLSMFNTDAIKHVSLYKDGFPARYGGRLSSVLDISMKEGNQEQWSGKLDIGALVNSVLIEGPLKKNQSSVLLTARAGNFGLLRFPQRIAFEHGKRNSYQSFGFYDLNAKVNYRFNDQHRVYLSYYHGYDQKVNNAQFKNISLSEEQLKWANTTLSSRYTATLGATLFGKATLAWTRYQYQIINKGFNQTFATDTTADYYDQQKLAGINDASIKLAINYLPHPKHNIRTGTDFTHHQYLPTAHKSAFKTVFNGQEQDTSFVNQQHISAQEIAIYAEDEWQIKQHWRINVGLRYSGFWVQQRYYHAIEPRANVYWKITKHTATKLSYCFMRQYIHLLTNYAIGFPNDIWVPATRRVAPQNAHQIAYSIDHTIPQQQIDIGAAIFYKKMNHLIDYTDGTNYLFNYSTHWEDIIATNGKGISKGIEIYGHKKTGRFNGWLNYTLSQSERKFTTINEGKIFPYIYDQLHNFNIVLNWQINARWAISTNWTYRTGRPVTLPTGMYQTEGGGIVYAYEERNNYRLPAYHRADIAISYTWNNLKNNYLQTLSAGAYNLYNRANPNYIVTGKFPSGIYFKQTSLFPIFPFINYSLKLP